MLAGTVSPRLEPYVVVRLSGPHNQVEIQILLDTGFTGFLKIDTYLAAHLGLTKTLVTRVVLADGSVVAVDLGLVEVFWRGQWRRELAMLADGGNLVGTALLRGSILTVKMVPGGPVRVRP